MFIFNGYDCLGVTDLLTLHELWYSVHGIDWYPPCDIYIIDYCVLSRHGTLYEIVGRFLFQK